MQVSCQPVATVAAASGCEYCVRPHTCAPEHIYTELTHKQHYQPYHARLTALQRLLNLHVY